MEGQPSTASLLSLLDVDAEAPPTRAGYSALRWR